MATTNWSYDPGSGYNAYRYHRPASCQFHRFFPEWNQALLNILNNDCIGASQALSYQRVIECLLEHIPPFRLQEMAAVSVILGLIPVLLQYLSPTVTEISLLAVQRPLLAILVANGTPLVSPLSERELIQSVMDLGSEPEDCTKQSAAAPDAPNKVECSLAGLGQRDRYNTVRHIMESVVTYVAVLACVVNNARLAYELGCWCICSFAQAASYLPAIWTALALALRFLCFAIFNLLVRVEMEVKNADGSSHRRGFKRHIYHEFMPTSACQKLFLVVETRTRLFHPLAEFVLLASTCHLVFGTIVLASLQFISFKDSVTVIGRYLASALVCRWVVFIEKKRLRGNGLVVERVAKEQSEANHNYHSIPTKELSSIDATA